MTSSSDTEFSKRRLYIDGLPHKVSSSEVREIFSPYGSVAFVHMARAGHGFVTFEEEDSAGKALELHGTTYKQCRLTVQPETEAAMPFPVVGAKREVYFPKPFVAAGSKASRSATSSQSNSSAAGTRTQRSGGRGLRLERKSSHPNMVKIIQSPSELVGSTGAPANDESFAQGFPEQYQRLFSFTYFPHVASKIFLMLDTVSLMRSRLVCSDWAHNIDHFILESPLFRPTLLSNWREAKCSISPLTPKGNDLIICKDSPEARYRNILSFKADEVEIILAVDNGNVEIYDRSSRKLLCMLIGQYSASPVKLDLNANLIFVQYTCAFAASRRRQSPSSWWNIYCRKTKRLLRSIDRDNAGPFVDLKLGVDSTLYLTTNSTIYAIDVVGSSKPQMNRMLTVEECIEAVDFDCNKVVVLVHLGKKLCFKLNKNAINVDAAKRHEVPMFDTTFEALPPCPAPDVLDFDEAKCHCMYMQVRYPLCMSLLSNNKGSFEYLGGKPYVLIVFTNLIREESVRILRLDSNWMQKMSDLLVPYDSESCLLSAQFCDDHLAVGFGSFSDRRDGAIALWKMSEILNPSMGEDELSVWTLPAPTYHWGSWDGHTGGINCLHLDKFGLIASNACSHRVTTRCIERGDESKKDNVLIYDFWRPGEDKRRLQPSLSA